MALTAVELRQVHLGIYSALRGRRYTAGPGSIETTKRGSKQQQNKDRQRKKEGGEKKNIDPGNAA
jgi:hypothetical protein